MGGKRHECQRVERFLYCGLLVLFCGYSGFFASTDARNASGNASEYCEGTTFSARCSGTDELIVMDSALFGRIRSGARCIKSPSSTNCQFNIRDRFDLWCSGRRACDVRVSSIVDLLPESMHCLQDHRGYLEASYSCVKVVAKRKEDCSGRNSVADLAVSGVGYLASVSTEETGCGSTEVPWVLRASPGQQIRLRMYDFGVAGRDADPAMVDQYPRVCQVYAVVKETPVRASETVCGGEEREQAVYTSVTNQLELRLVAASVAPKKNQTRDVYYMIRYEVTGCPDLIPGPGQWIARQDLVSTLVCNATGEKWQLNCEDGEWTGRTRNCTATGSGGSDQKTDLIWAIFSGSQWAAIAIVLGIAVAIGLIVFLVGLFYLKRRRPASLRGGDAGACISPHCIPSYHMAPCTDAILPAPGSKSLRSTRSAADANYASSAENDYFRTWQLQRQVAPLCSGGGGGGGQSPGPRFAVLRACPPGGQFQGPVGAAPGGTDPGVPLGGGGGRRAVIEHIYESPKFERRETLVAPEGDESPGQRPGTPLQYHELDPHGVRSQ